MARSTRGYRPRKADRDAEVRQRLKELAAKRIRFGYRRLTTMLVQEGVEVNISACIALSRGRIGDAPTAATADPLEWSGGQLGSGEAESAVVDGFCE